MSTLTSPSRSLPLQESLPQTATPGEWVQRDADLALVLSQRRACVKLACLIAASGTSAYVKGFRMPAVRGRGRMHGGRRPKSLEGGNRGGVCAGGGVGLWGFNARR